MRPYSLSRINCFKSCPMKYKLSYLDKVEQEPANEALVKGSSIHEALETLDTSNSYVDKFFKSDIGKKYKHMIENGQKELKIGIDFIDNQLVPCEFSDTCLYRGVIDVLYENNIFDYKSGKYRPEQSWKQLCYYALWLFLSTDYDEVNIAYLFVEHNKENRMTLKRGQVIPIIKHFLTDIILLRDYEENPVEKYNPSYLCEYCSVRKHCKMNTDNLLKLNDLS